MAIGRVGKAEFFLQIHLPRRTAQEIHPSYHLGDTRFPIIHHHRQLVDITSVCPTNHKVTAIGGQVLRKASLQQILQVPQLIRHLHSPSRFPAKSRLFRLRQVSASAGIDIGTIGQVGRIHIVKLAAGAKAGIEQPFVHEFFKITIVNFAALALGRLFFLPRKTQPQQIFPQGLGKLCAGALGIQILHPQHDAAISALHRQPCDQKRKHIAQMHPSGRRGRKASYGLNVHSSTSFESIIAYRARNCKE